MIQSLGNRMEKIQETFNKLLFKTRETKAVKEREILTKFVQGL